MRTLIILLATCASLSIPRTLRADISLPAAAEECVRFGAGDVDAALAAAHVTDSHVTVTLLPPRTLGRESFSLGRAKNIVTIEADNAVGAMYGLEELAEQIRNSGSSKSWDDLVTKLHPTEQHPAIDYRADNPFIHLQPLLINNLPMWHAYIDMLARNRFNVLDMHGGYEFTSTKFPCLYPLLVTVPEYPQAGNPAEQAKNLEDFKAIVAYAKSRGVKVALMNYTAEAPGVAAAQLADYTAKAVALLIRAVPDLYMLGFRVGESGQPADFFNQSYLKGFADSGRKDLRLYTRSWLTTQDKLERIGQAAGGQFDIEIKFNGEHLGLPYQAIQGYGASYSYQGYIQADSPYRIIWQIRANGTHNYWAWADASFIRRTMQAVSLGHARGFTLEPHIAYFPVDTAWYYRKPADQTAVKWIWEKHWMWYFTWGRLAYNPDLPEETLVAGYANHYGPAGPAIYRAMQAAGPIVPMVYSYRCIGLDQRDVSPETDTGLFKGKERKPQAKKPKTGAATKPTPKAAPKPATRPSAPGYEFSDNHPLDGRSFIGIDLFVKNRIDGKADGRITPVQVADIVGSAAERTRKAVDAVSAAGELKGQAADEWRLLRTDLLSASDMGEYFSNRVMGTMHYDYAVRTGSAADYAKAETYLGASRLAWSELAKTADAVFSRNTNRLRAEIWFHWADRVMSLEQNDMAWAQSWAKAPHHADAPPLLVTPQDHGRNINIHVSGISHVLLLNGKAMFLCTATAPAGIREMLLWYKPLPSESPWASMPMTRTSADTYRCIAPITPVGMMFLVEVRDQSGAAMNYPPVLEQTPYQVIEPWSVTSRP